MAYDAYTENLPEIPSLSDLPQIFLISESCLSDNTNDTPVNEKTASRGQSYLMNHLLGTPTIDPLENPENYAAITPGTVIDIGMSDNEHFKLSTKLASKLQSGYIVKSSIKKLRHVYIEHENLNIYKDAFAQIIFVRVRNVNTTGIACTTVIDTSTRCRLDLRGRRTKINAKVPSQLRQSTYTTGDISAMVIDIYVPCKTSAAFKQAARITSNTFEIWTKL